MLPALVLLLAAKAATMSPACVPIPGAQIVLKNPQLRWVVVGEQHGTREMPSSFADLICEAARRRARVVVALERPVDEQKLLDAYLSSDGGAKARERFLSGPAWHSKVADGRTSRAFLSLIERLRRMKKAGQIDRVIAFQPTNSSSAAEYESQMARNIEAAASPSPLSLTLVLVGNVHAQMTKFTLPNGESYLPMAALLPRQQTMTLNMVDNGGSAWECIMPPGATTAKQIECGPQPLPSPASPYPRGIVPNNGADAAYMANLYLGSTVSSSDPAVSVGSGRRRSANSR